MNGYNFTERVRRTLAMAREEAARLHHEYVGTEHILLGLIREGGSVGFDVLEKLGDPAVIAETIKSTVKRGKLEEPTGPDLPYTSRAKKVLELAMAEARELNHSYVGTEHLLLGLLREEKGIAAQVLIHHGVTLPRTRETVAAILGSDAAPKPPDRLVSQLTDDAPTLVAGRTYDVDPTSPWAALLRYFAVFSARDIAQMSEIWSGSGRASRIAPDYEIVSGWPDVARSYQHLFAKTLRLSIDVNDVSLSALGAAVFIVGVEVWTIERTCGSVRVGVDTTRVFRREGTEWRLVHEHASAGGLDALRAYQELLAAD